MTLKNYLASNDLIGTAKVTAIVECNGKTVVRLDQTWFHAQGGGQKADRGTIAGQVVHHVAHAEDGQVDHVVDAAPFEIGDAVELIVDADWRQDGRRWHSAGHLIADCAEAVCAQIKARQGHHWPGEARVEFDGEPGDKVRFNEDLQAAIDRAIEEGVAMNIVGDPFANRALQIGENLPVCCGGTHVASARELKGLTITKAKTKRGNLRVSYGFGRG
ncbi:hypothetical protein [Erythrobacter sp. YT30]|uniref:hypothetical protein n=1 Tax=Erythrobacter sp. YT30 TaxID=1735012 RepID=UPI00076C7921|nr:hypothetical protein [Erythrobacter sp. YT30]KWV91765.1 hypothetical protein AUC45_11210 [Erythrobacter sp. YT30]